MSKAYDASGPTAPRAYTHSATHSALIRKGKSERLSNMKGCRTLVILAICALVAGAGAISTHRGNIRGMPVSSARKGAEEATGESPTSKARGISDFRPAEHAPEDVTEQDIRNKPAMDTSAGCIGGSVFARRQQQP